MSERIDEIESRLRDMSPPQQEESRDVVAPCVEFLACRALSGIAIEVVSPDMLDIPGVLDRSIDILVE